MKQDFKEKIIEKELLKHLKVSVVDNQKNHKEINFDINDIQTPYNMLKLQEEIMTSPEDFPIINLNVNNQLKEINTKPLLETKADIQEITSQINENNNSKSPIQQIQDAIITKEKELKKLDRISKTIDNSLKLVESYKTLEKKYDERLQTLSKNLDETLGLNSIKISTQQKQVSPIKKKFFSSLLNKGKKIFTKIRKQEFPNLMSSPKISPIKEQQLNNALYQRLKIKEKMLKNLDNFKIAQNPEQIANEILSVLLDPLKATLKKENPKPLITKPKEALSNITITIDNKEYHIKQYTEDKSNIIVMDNNQKQFKIATDRNFKIKIPENQINLTDSQKKLIDNKHNLKGKFKDLDVIYQKNKLGSLEVTTATKTQLINSNSKKYENINKKGIKI